MKKKLPLIFSLFLICFSATAQRADNFILRDLEGTEHNLYEYLNEGKKVVMDVATTWCEPCWIFHQNGVLEQIHEADEDIVVLFVEADLRFNADCLSAGPDCDDPSNQGNWLDGFDLPAVHLEMSDVMPSDFLTGAVPSVFTICPDGTFHVIQDGGSTAIQYLELANGCADFKMGANNVGSLESAIGTVGCGPEERISPVFEAKNLGTEVLTSFDANLIIGGETVETITWTGELETFDHFSGETAELVFSDVTVSSASELTCELVMPNGMTDDNTDDNSFSVLLGQTAGLNVNFLITTDFWPEETSWEMTDDTGQVLFSSADEGALTCDNTYIQSAVLEADKCYTFSVRDAFGDGILNGAILPDSHNCTTNNGNASNAVGTISLSTENGVLFDDIAYGEGAFVQFLALGEEVVVSGIDDVRAVSEFAVTPNPASEVIRLQFQLEETSNVSMDLLDITGKVLMSNVANQFGAGPHQNSFDISELPAGVYIARLTANGKSVAKRVVKAH